MKAMELPREGRKLLVDDLSGDIERDDIGRQYNWMQGHTGERRAKSDISDLG